MSRPPAGHAPAAGSPQYEPAALGRRLLSLAYEALLLAAVLWLAGILFALVEQKTGAAHARLAFQLYLVAAAAVYFVPQWAIGGQTLPMKTWRIRLVARNGQRLTVPRACARYVLALLGLAACGLGYWWAFLDPDRQFLHDRLADTRLVRT
jgi:uncharacterized RDD family membrane protein YckC